MKKQNEMAEKQEMHLKGARAIRDINNPNWRDGNGRKPKKDIVQKWRSEHPEGKKPIVFVIQDWIKRRSISGG